MFHDFKSEIKLFLIVAAASAVLAVAGVLLVKNVSNQVTHTPPPAQQTPPPAPSPQPSAAPATPRDQAELDFAGWQTYRSDEYGFEVKYPEVYSIRTNNTNGNLSFTIIKEPPGGDPYMSLRVGKEEDIEKADLNIINPKQVANREIAKTEETISGQEWQRVEVHEWPIEGRGTAGHFLTFYQEHNDLVYVLYCLQCNQEVFGDYGAATNQFLYQILSTFRFVE